MVSVHSYLSGPDIVEAASAAIVVSGRLCLVSRLLVRNGFLPAFQTEINGVNLSLSTEAGLFSPGRLDRGTQALLNCLTFEPEDRVLDLGCGCGVVGIYAAHLIGASRVFLTDNDPVAVACARANAVANGCPELSVTLSDGFQSFEETGFTKILSNPPYHADFSVPKQFILKGFNRLSIGGQMWFVTKRDTWYRNRLRAVFGGVRVVTQDSYFVLMAEKRSHRYAEKP